MIFGGDTKGYCRIAVSSPSRSSLHCGYLQQFLKNTCSIRSKAHSAHPVEYLVAELGLHNHVELMHHKSCNMQNVISSGNQLTACVCCQSCAGEHACRQLLSLPVCE